MSRLHEQKCCTRLSDPNLHKYTLYCSPTSEEEIPCLYRSQLSSSLLSRTQQYLPMKETLSEYCLCGKQYSRKKSSYETLNNKKLKCLKCQEPQKIKEDLEMYLTGTQVEQALAEDRQTALMQHLDLSTVALEALVQYGQSLQVSQLAACRVLNISHLLAFPQPYSISYKPDSTGITVHLQQLKIQKENKITILQDLIEYCSKHIVFPKHLNDLMNENYMKKKDYYIATRNFKNFLSNSKLSILQMEKLNRQYESILNNYQQSRYMLELELPKVINVRLAVLQDGFEKIKKFYNDDDANEVLTLFTLIGEKLCINNSDTAAISHDQYSPKPELCQKCKINPVDKK